VQALFLLPGRLFRRELDLQLQAFAPQLSGSLIVALLACFLLFLGQFGQRDAHGLEIGRQAMHRDAHTRCGLVHQVDGLIWQAPVAHVPVRQSRRGHQGLVRDFHMVMGFVALLEPAKHGDRVVDGWLLHKDRRKTPLQRAIALDVLSVLVQRGGADALQLPARQGWLHHVGSVDRPLCGTGPNHGVQFIDKQDDLSACLLHLFKHTLESFLEFASKAGTCHHGAQIEGEDMPIQQVLRHVTTHDLLRQSFHDRRFAHTGLANQHRVVFSPTGEDL